jgi:hypothetical protein
MINRWRVDTKKNDLFGWVHPDFWIEKNRNKKKVKPEKKI